MQAATHPIGLYLKVWLLLFVLSTFSYLVDFFHVAGYLRWMLILLLMVAKAGLIVAVFMHLRWERAALIYVVLAPPACLLVLAWLMWLESGYTYFTRLLYFR
ncbi:cytochrome C oxidase subunit IV [Rugamonas sp. FT107W]|uniref:Cytochrome C oxidase subunit IV n=1 Tax=Duganella vulcania TaxID=2692166 RepID=A0A845HF70_9BURK|nr:cytochrome C oxidase subunit IV family protein [Duganella vulcania]MYN15326.1 cytochrome C oxidase subunit IV [Duganella vulcania]